MSDPRPLLKDQLFHRDNVARIASEIAAVHARLDADSFVARVVSRFPELELKQRIAWISQCLRDHLPDDFRAATGALLASLPAPCNPDLRDGDFGDFIYAPYSHFVAANGCTEANLAFSLAALREITTRFSAEDAIRSFLNSFPEPTLAALHEWTSDPHYHVRRLCSEGTRPRLPWSVRLTIPSVAAVPLLDRLFCDPTRFVTRSVANHVNDIAKDAPDTACALLERWQQRGGQTDNEMRYIIRHATRTLVKEGHRRAFVLNGVPPDAAVTLSQFTCAESVALGDTLEFAFTVTSAADADVVVDYALHFPTRSGKMSRKVYKLQRLALPAGVPTAVRKRHALAAAMTTRPIIPGTHYIEVLINGVAGELVPFTVVAQR